MRHAHNVQRQHGLHAHASTLDTFRSGMREALHLTPFHTFIHFPCPQVAGLRGTCVRVRPRRVRAQRRGCLWELPDWRLWRLHYPRSGSQVGGVMNFMMKIADRQQSTHTVVVARITYPARLLTTAYPTTVTQNPTCSLLDARACCAAAVRCAAFCAAFSRHPRVCCSALCCVVLHRRAPAPGRHPDRGGPLPCCHL